MSPRPRDFTGAVFKIRSTASGQLPTDADLARAIDQGLPGTAMPDLHVSADDAKDIVAHLYRLR